MTRISRGLFLAASSAAVSAFVPAVSSAAPRVRGLGQALSSVVVDVDGLRGLASPPRPILTRSVMTAELQTVFADGLGGQRLTVRLTGLTLSAYVGGGQEVAVAEAAGGAAEAEEEATRTTSKGRRWSLARGAKSWPAIRSFWRCRRAPEGPGTGPTTSKGGS